MAYKKVAKTTEKKGSDLEYMVVIIFHPRQHHAITTAFHSAYSYDIGHFSASAGCWGVLMLILVHFMTLITLNKWLGLSMNDHRKH